MLVPSPSPVAGAPDGGIATAASFVVDDGDPVIRQTA
jgi:hypothetical protein